MIEKLPGEKWVCASEEGYFDSEEYLTKEEAKESYPEYASLEEDNIFWVGRAVNYKPVFNKGDIDRILETFEENACEYTNPDFVDGWLCDSTKEKRELLRVKLTNAFCEWMKETNNEPGFYIVEDIEECKVPENDEEEGE